MAKVNELVVDEQRRHLEQVAAIDGWTVKALSSISFIVGFTARDGSPYWARCDADGYPGVPPAWHWSSENGDEIDLPALTPKGGGSAFLHPNGVICAPWNRLAYRCEDARGPHDDWTIGNWFANSYTGECKTLAAMAIRISIELQTRYSGRALERAA